MEMKNIKTVETDSSHFNQIMEVEKMAFGSDEEAELVAHLLADKSAEPVVSLLAFHGEEAVGHILFTRAWLEGDAGPKMHILAPLAVKPAFQKQGIGGLLIREGIEKLKLLGVELVFVLGHIEYYPKYGFTPNAAKFGLLPTFPVPDEVADAWMVQALTGKGIGEARGRVICADEMNKLEYWRE